MTDHPHHKAESEAKPGRVRVGRPAVLSEAARRALLFNAAARVFLAKGYAAATMRMIAAEAGMSKKTVYQVFPSKVALFDALLENRIFQTPAEADLEGCDAEEGLTRLVTAIASMLLLPDRMGLIRLIIADGQSSPELMTAFERLKLAKDMNALELWLKQAQDQGCMRRGDVHDDARLLFGMTIAEPMLQALVNAPPYPDEPPVDQRLRNAVRVFLRGMAAGA